MSDLPASIHELRSAIWDAAGHNIMYIVYAKQHINWNHSATDHTPFKWAQLLGEVRRDWRIRPVNTEEIITLRKNIHHQ